MPLTELNVIRSCDNNVAHNCLKCYFLFFPFFFISVRQYIHSAVCSALVFHSEHRLSLCAVERHYGMAGDVVMCLSGERNHVEID